MSYDMPAHSQSDLYKRRTCSARSTAARARRSRIDRLDRVARFLDSRYRVPVLSIPVGWDPILGLIPGVGALVTLAPAVAMIYEAHQIGARRRARWRMAANTVLDMAIGLIPVIGDVGDVFFKSHRRNIAILKAEVARL